MERVSHLVAERERVTARLRELGYDFPSTYANFVWLPLGERTGEFVQLMSEHALSVRAFGAAGVRVSMAVGCGGRQEIVDAVRSVLREAAAEGASLDSLAEQLSVEDISSHLYTADMPDPDLLIRTSGEQRLSGFMTWQSAYSEFYFCRALWPDFTRVDFLRALRDYANRSRRFGS